MTLIKGHQHKYLHFRKIELLSFNDLHGVLLQIENSMILSKVTYYGNDHFILIYLVKKGMVNEKLGEY